MTTECFPSQSSVLLDRLSSLPEEIIHIIFLFMPITDVVRTSALSRIWRYKWMSIPMDHGRCKVEDVLGGLVNVRDVYVLKHFIEKLFNCSTPERFCVTFPDLNYISLEMKFEDCKEFFAPLCIFGSSPCLQVMTIMNCSNKQEYSNEQNCTTKQLVSNQGDFLQALLHENEVIIPKLKTLEIVRFRGMDHEMRFIGFILLNGVVLEAVSVTWDISIYKNLNRRNVVLNGLFGFIRPSKPLFFFKKPA